MESYEGGCRTPLVVHWPAGLKQQPGSIVRDVGHVIDIAPTCLDLAGVKVDGSDSGDEFQMDGVSLRPVLAATGPVEDRTLFFMHNDGRGVQRGKYKASKRHEHGWELFDLEKDPGETHDISGEEPEVLTRWCVSSANGGAEFAKRSRIVLQRRRRKKNHRSRLQPTAALRRFAHRRCRWWRAIHISAFGRRAIG